MEINQKIDLIEKAKRTIDILKRAGVKASLQMGVIGKVYFAVQKILQSRTRDDVKLLAAGAEEPTVNNEPKSWELTPEQLKAVNPTRAVGTIEENSKEEKEEEIIKE